MTPWLGADGKKSPLNLAIVGGGRACRFFLELLQRESFPFLDIRIVGVCDIDPDAEGLRLARQMGIYTTDNFGDLFTIDQLDSIVELTGNRQVLLELIKQRPKGVGVIEHNIGRLLRSFFLTDQRVKSLEQELLSQRGSSDFLIQHSNAAIVVLNTDFTVAEANDSFLSLVKRTRQEAIGAMCYEISHGLAAPCPEAHTGLKCPMVETLRTGKSAHVIHEMPGAGFEAAYCNIVTYPLMDQNRRIIRVIEIWRDISEEIASRWSDRFDKLKVVLKNMIQEDRMISLGKLVASCVHEINNPIQGLMTFTAVMQSMLAEDTLSGQGVLEFRHFLGLMSAELERCGKIVSGLLSFSRETPTEYRPVDLNDILRSVTSLTCHKMELQQIELRRHLAETPVIIDGDTNQLQQCLLNLVFNAMEAMPEGGILAIRSRLDAKHATAVIEIEDTGCGIAEAHLDQIFNPFFTTKAEGQGTGLGLSIVHGVVKVHHGEVRVESRVGEGSRFVLIFPQSKTSAVAAQEGHGN
jgi:two-component system NtrC family sensor kinase